MKNFIKKIVIILLLLPLNVLAETVTTFTLNEITASSGNNITVNLDINNNPEFGMLAAKIYYDKNSLEYVSSEVKGLKNAILKGAEDNKKGAVVLYAIDLDKKKLMKDTGTILTIEFKINKSVTEDIPLKLEVTDFGVDENNLLKFETKNGIIHIKDKINTKAKEDSKTITEEIKEKLKEENIKIEDVTIESNNDEVAEVDEDGNVTIKKDGNVTIGATDKEGNTVYKEDLYIKNNVKKKNRLLKPIIYIIAFILVVGLGIIIWKKRKK